MKQYTKLYRAVEGYLKKHEEGDLLRAIALHVPDADAALTNLAELLDQRNNAPA